MYVQQALHNVELRFNGLEMKPTVLNWLEKSCKFFRIMKCSLVFFGMTWYNWPNKLFFSISTFRFLTCYSQTRYLLSLRSTTKQRYYKKQIFFKAHFIKWNLFQTSAQILLNLHRTQFYAMFSHFLVGLAKVLQELFKLKKMNNLRRLNSLI